MIAVVSIAVRTLYSSGPLSLQYSASVNAAIEAVDPGCLPPLITPLMSGRHVCCVYARQLYPFTKLADGTTRIDGSQGGRKNESVKLKNYRFSHGKRKRKQKEATSWLTRTQAEYILCAGQKGVLRGVEGACQHFLISPFTDWQVTKWLMNFLPPHQLTHSWAITNPWHSERFPCNSTI